MKIKLLSNQIEYLINLPEQGMGYQIVDVVLKNGTVLKKYVVFNSSYLKLNDDEKIVADDIAEITLSS